MSIAYLQGQKQRIRVTLELEVYEDFDARNINWERLFNLEGDERVDAYVEDLSSWWHKTFIRTKKDQSPIVAHAVGFFSVCP